LNKIFHISYAITISFRESIFHSTKIYLKLNQKSGVGAEFLIYNTPEFQSKDKTSRIIIGVQVPLAITFNSQDVCVKLAICQVSVMPRYGFIWLAEVKKVPEISGV
jgi:hypothetical protein